MCTRTACLWTSRENDLPTVDTAADSPEHTGNYSCGEPGGLVDDRRLRIVENPPTVTLIASLGVTPEGRTARVAVPGLGERD